MAEYKISEGNAEALVSDVGGTILRFTVNGKDIFFPWHKTEDGKERGGCPMCAPILGPSEFFDKKHGYLRYTRAAEASYEDDSTLCLKFNHPGSQRYPWMANYELRVSIRNSLLYVLLKITRQDDGFFDMMPVDPGFHPYFAGNGNAIEVLHGTEHRSGFGGPAKSVFAGSRNIFIDENKSPKFMIKLGGEFSEKSMILMWSDSVKEYFCVEPLLGDRKLFNTPQGRRLGIGESLHLSMTISSF